MANSQAFGIVRDTFFHGDNEALLHHVCPPTDDLEGPLDPVPADRGMRRDLMTRMDLALPPNVAARVGRDEIQMWIIENNDDNRPVTEPREAYPSPLIRTVQGEVIHARVGAKVNTHTIHWHGIEPTAANDGVGKHSFEISGNFVYQFQTNEAGTYFYHCHKNTTLHFHMGLWGGFVVDPMNPIITADNDLSDGLPFDFTELIPPYTTFGPGYAAGMRSALGLSEGEAIPYHQERVWAVDSLQFNWHFPVPHHNHNMQDCDNNDPAGADTFYKFGTATMMGEFELNEFDPDIFSVTGVVMDEETANPYTGVIDNPAITINAGAGEIVLLRYVNASYTIQELRLPVDAWVIAWDGHPLGTGGFHQVSSPYKVPAGTPIRTTSARRMDIIIDTRGLPGPVEGFATIRVYDWIRGPVPAGLIAEISIPVNTHVVAPPQPDDDVVVVDRARFNPRNRRFEVRAASNLGLPMTAQVFAGDISLGTFDLDARGRLAVTLPGTLIPTNVVVRTDRGVSDVDVGVNPAPR